MLPSNLSGSQKKDTNIWHSERKKDHQPRILCPAKISLNHEGKIKTFSDMQEWKELITHRHRRSPEYMSKNWQTCSKFGAVMAADSNIIPSKTDSVWQEVSTGGLKSTVCQPTGLHWHSQTPSHTTGCMFFSRAHRTDGTAILKKFKRIQVIWGISSAPGTANQKSTTERSRGIPQQKNVILHVFESKGGIKEKIRKFFKRNENETVNNQNV